MAQGTGTGNAGSEYGARNYIGTYSPEDFHHNPNDLQSNCIVNDFHSADNVQRCDLLGMPDLDTSSDHVTSQLAKYIDSLYDAGCDGIRIDAAKHQAPGDIAKYLAKTKAIKERGEEFFVFQEVIGAPGEAVTPDQYYENGQVTEFGFGYDVGNDFKQASKLQPLLLNW
jgi:alpha-amylase